MQKTILTVALIAAAEAAKKAGIPDVEVVIKARPELPEVCMIEPVNPPPASMMAIHGAGQASGKGNVRPNDGINRSRFAASG